MPTVSGGGSSGDDAAGRSSAEAEDTHFRGRRPRRLKGLLERSVANVVENAVKYSPDGQPVTVSASALADRVEVRVVDRGPGVPDEAKDRIFAPFQRYGDAPRGAGVGLGLAVARGFAEAMGGTLTAEDTPGGGLTMVLTLPAAPGHPPPQPGLRATATS